MKTRRGQVLVEFALAVAGLAAMAFVTARVAYWMNQSLVERNERYQATRTQAGKQGAGLVEVGAVPDIRLIGPASARTSPGTSREPDALQASCDDGGRLARANRIRQEDVPRLHEELVYLRQQLFETMNESKGPRNEAKRIEEIEGPTLRYAANQLRAPVPCPPNMVETNEGKMCGPPPDALAQADALDAQANDLERRVVPDLKRRARELNDQAEPIVRRMRRVSALAQRTLGQAHEAEWSSRVACASGTDAF